MRKIVAILIICIAPLSAASEWQADLGYRRDHLKWNIGTWDVNVLSELTWRKLDTIAVGARYQWYSPRCYTIFAEGSLGYIIDGESQDSDWALPNRKGEFSRAFADTDGVLGDLSAGLGLVLHSGCWTWIPHVGGGFRGMYLRMSGLRRRIEYNPEEDLPSGVVIATYSPTIWAGFVGLEVRHCSGSFEWRASGQFHWGYYRGYGDWKLRRDFNNFIDTATAYGFVGRIDGIWNLSPCWRVLVGVGAAYWGTSVGVQIKHGNDPNFGRWRQSSIFNEAQWVTLSAHIGMLRLF